MPKVHVLGYDQSYVRMYEAMGWKQVMIDDADVIQFTGGEDVSPHLYGERVHPRSFCNPVRDAAEAEVYDRYKGKKPLVGICRGGQFLNVMSGGKMYQHHSGHPSYHKAFVHATTDTVMVSSTHHQLMRPGENGIVLMSASEGVIAERMVGVGKIEQEVPDWETEAVIYKDDGVLCFQPHPEFAVYDKRIEGCMFQFFDFVKEVMK